MVDRTGQVWIHVLDNRPILVIGAPSTEGCSADRHAHSVLVLETGQKARWAENTYHPWEKEDKMRRLA